jgi:chromosome segregation ATPase
MVTSGEKNSLIQSASNLQNQSDDSGNTFDNFATGHKEQFFISQQLPNSNPSKPEKKHSKRFDPRGQIRRSNPVGDNVGFFTKKESEGQEIMESNSSQRSRDNIWVSDYETNKTQKQEFGMKHSRMSKPARIGLYKGKKFISRDNIDDTLISNQSNNDPPKNNNMRRSVQHRMRHSNTSSMNFGFKSSKKTQNVPKAKNLDRNHQKNSGSQKDVFEALSNYSEMTSNFQERIKGKLKTRQRRQSKSRGISRENRLSRRRNMVSPSPSKSIKLTFKPRGHSRMGSIQSLSKSINPGKQETNEKKSSVSMMVATDAQKPKKIGERSRTNNSIFGDFMESEKKGEVKRKTLLAKNVNVIKKNQKKPEGEETRAKSPSFEKESVEKKQNKVKTPKKIHEDQRVMELEQKIKKLEQEKKEVQEMCDFYKNQDSEDDDSTTSKVELLEGEMEELKAELMKVKEELGKEKELNSKLLNNKSEWMKKKEEIEEHYKRQLQEARAKHLDIENELKREINQLDEMVKKLKREALEDSLLGESGHFNELTLEQQVQRLKIKNKVLQKEKEFLIKEKKRLSKNMTELEEKSNQSDALKSMKSTSQWEQQINDLTLKLSEMKRECQEFKVKEQQFGEKEQELISKLESLQLDTDDKTLKIEELNRKIQDFELRLAEEAEAQEGRTEKKEQAEQKRIELLKNQIGTLEEDLGKQREIFRAQLKEKDGKLEESGNLIEEQKGVIEGVKKDKEVLQNLVNKLTGEKNDINKKLESAQEQVFELKGEIKKNQEDIENLKKDNSFQKDHVESLVIEIENKNKTIKNLEIELNQTKDSLKTKSKEMEELQLRNKNLENTNNENSEKLEKVSEELTTIKNKKKEEDDELEDQREMLQYENDKLKKNAKMMELKIASLKSNERALIKTQQLLEKNSQSLEKKAKRGEELEKERTQVLDDLERARASKKLLEKDVQKSMMKIGKTLELLNSLKLSSKQKDMLMNVLVSG